MLRARLGSNNMRLGDLEGHCCFNVIRRCQNKLHIRMFACRLFDTRNNSSLTLKCPSLYSIQHTMLYGPFAVRNHGLSEIPPPPSSPSLTRTQVYVERHESRGNEVLTTMNVHTP